MVRAENTELVDTFEQFFRRYYSDEIEDLAQNYPGEQRSLHVDWTDLYRFNPDLADEYLTSPSQLRKYAEEALRVYDLPIDVSLGMAHVRVHNLDNVSSIDGIRSRHLNTLVSVQGTVEWASGVQSDLQEGAFECQRCGTLTFSPNTGRGDVREPNQCQGCERDGPFAVNVDQSEYVDAQTILVKQRPANASTEDGVSIVVELYDDITGEVTPGDTVTVTGVVTLLDDDEDRTEATIPDKILTAHHVSIEDDWYLNLSLSDDNKQTIVALSNEDDIYDQLVASFAPTVYGYEQEKLAILLQLFSGVTKHLPDDTRIRGDLHIGLMGDPGTAKSRLLDYAGKLAPRTVTVSGTGSSEVGLTASMKRTKRGSKTWAVEAGALPLADRGVACLDDLDKFSSEQRGALASVLEQQRITVNKATVSETLKARASVLAAANPKYGRFDQYEPIGEQVDLEPGLITQFDLFFTVTDDPDEDRDEAVADHVLQSNYAGELNTQHAELGTAPTTSEDVTEAVEEIQPPIEPDLLRKYIAYARQNCFPTMTEAAKETIEDFYVDLRSKGADEDAPVPVSARKLEALVRLSEASARARLSDEVARVDAERAVEITRSCLRDLGVDPETGEFDADVVDSKDEDELTKEERDRLKNLKQLIAKIEDNYEDGAPVDKVLKHADEIGMSSGKAEHEIDKLKQKGEVYEPSTDHLRTT